MTSASGETLCTGDDPTLYLHKGIAPFPLFLSLLEKGCAAAQVYPSFPSEGFLFPQSCLQT